jgi:protocatechuate 3,4-dioxygenase beta subunit
MLMKRVVVILLMIGALAVDALGQGPPQGGMPRRPGLPGGRMGPARDPREQQTGTSAIRGRIVAADTGTPIRRAQVRAIAGELRESRIATTDAEGRFELKDLPAGRWDLTATKAGFVSLRFGQRRPFEAGRPIELGDKETMTRADFALPRGAAITGRILDEFGEPVAMARVQVMRYQAFQGSRRLMPVGIGDQTDDTGAYRLYGLSPGDYYVSAVLRGGMMMAVDVDESNSYAPTYFPGTGNPAEAQRITIGLGQEHPNVSFALLPTRTVKVTGTVVDSSGKPLSNGFVALVDAAAAPGAGGMFMIGGGNGRVRPDGTFSLSSVAPGSYTLMATVPPFGSDSVPETASMPLTVGNEDLAGIHLVTGKGATVTGQIVAAEGSSGRLATDGLMVMAQPIRFQPMMGSRPSRVESDGRFKLVGAHGQVVIRPMQLPSTWMLKTVTLNGNDITDTPLEIRPDADLNDVQIVVTDRVPEVNGKVVDDKGQPTRDYTVMVFPEDSAKWAYPSRHVRTGRADQEGLYKIRGLPGEVEYLAVAVDYLEEGEGNDPQFLEQMRDRAIRFRLADGEVKALDLKLVVR